MASCRCCQSRPSSQDHSLVRYLTPWIEDRNNCLVFKRFSGPLIFYTAYLHPQRLKQDGILYESLAYDDPLRPCHLSSLQACNFSRAPLNTTMDASRGQWRTFHMDKLEKPNIDPDMVLHGCKNSQEAPGLNSYRTNRSSFDLDGTYPYQCASAESMPPGSEVYI